MASNFKISAHRTSDGLHLKLMGDFDGSSAHELINTLKTHHGNVGKIFVHTSSLTSIHPFGLDVFKKKCSINGLRHGLTFTGKYEEIMTPPKSSLS